MEEKNLGGRPPKYNTPQDLQDKVDQYFEWIKGEKEQETDEDGKVIGEKFTRFPVYPAITGLADFLGFESRQSFYDYEKNEGFSYAIKKARLRIEGEYEQRLYSSAPTGAIFALKNMGWKDKQEHDIRTPDGLVINFVNQDGNAPLTDED